MSPLEIEILLHYYRLPTDYRGGDFTPEVKNAIELLRDEYNLLELTHSMDEFCVPHYTITERGSVFVEALCNMPLPIKMWVMP